MPEKIPTTEASPKTKSEKEVAFEEVAELETPMKIVIEKILPRIEGGEYGLIIGDDASGRIPALILGNFIKKVSEQKGLNKLNIIFIPGKLRRDLDEQSLEKRKRELNEHISRWGADKNKRILIVTDTIRSGSSLADLVKALRELDYVIDIATITAEDLWGPIEKKQRDIYMEGVDIISGEYTSPVGRITLSGKDVPLIYGKKLLSGVKKTPADEKSTPVKELSEDLQVREDIQDYINLARKDANIVTKHLLDWYQSHGKLSQNEK